MKLARSPSGTTHRYNEEHQRTLCGRQFDGPWSIVEGERPTCRTCVYMRTRGTFSEEQIERATDALAARFEGWTWSRDRWRKIVLTVAEELR